MKLLAVLFSLIAIGCSQAAKRPDPIVSSLKPVAIKGPVVLQLKSEPPRNEVIQYKTRIYSETREGGEVRHQQDSETDFTIKSTVTPFPQALPGVRQVLETTRKDGQIPLSSLALPEKDEVIEMHLAPDGTVIRAGNYPPMSLYYVPPVSLPRDPVRIGDTWSMTSRWRNLDDGVPFILEMVSILKGFVACGNDECADVELSGDVRFDGPEQPALSFTSHWEGRMLFAKNTGTVVWMRIDSLENLRAENVYRVVHSCLENVLQEPVELKTGLFEEAKCDRESAPEAVRLR